MLCAFPEVTEIRASQTWECETRVWESAGGDGRGEVSLRSQGRGLTRTGLPGLSALGLPLASGEVPGGGGADTQHHPSGARVTRPTAIMLLSALVETEGIVCAGRG